jgi:hypothetical protein
MVPPQKTYALLYHKPVKNRYSKRAFAHYFIICFNNAVMYEFPGDDEASQYYNFEGDDHSDGYEIPPHYADSSLPDPDLLPKDISPDLED